MSTISTPPAAELLAARANRHFSIQQLFTKLAIEAKQMRDCQALYFKSRDPHALRMSKQKEQAVDWLLREIDEKLYLFDLHQSVITLKSVEEVADVVL